MRIFLAIFFTLILSITASAEVNKAAIEQQFANWLSKDFYAEALKNGISADVYKQTLLNIKPNLQLPDLVIPGENPKAPKRQHQAEFGSPANYFSEKSIATLVSNGKTQFKAQSKTLKSIEKQYGVPQGIAVAVWGRESAYGTVKIPYNTFEVLATKAFMSNRKDMFRDELGRRKCLGGMKFMFRTVFHAALKDPIKAKHLANGSRKVSSLFPVKNFLQFLPTRKSIY